MINVIIKKKIFYLEVILIIIFLAIVIYSIVNFHPYLFLLSLTLFFKFIIFGIRTFSNYLISFIIVITTIIICELIFNLYQATSNPGFYDKRINTMFVNDQNEIGYKLKNGNHNFKFYLSENGKIKKLFENNYSIKYNTRVQNKDFQLNNCPKFIFLGGSHNFGQALDFNDTVQGNLHKHGTTLNFSAPGYGFNHSFWRVVNDENLLKKNCLDQKTDEKIFIYRYMFMNGHLIRNMGLHSYNKNGPDFRNNKLPIYKNLISNKNFIKSYCYNFYSCLSYHSQYTLYRIISVFRYSDTLIAKNLGAYIEKKLYFTEKSINHTIDVLKLFKDYLNINYPKNKLIVYVENISFKNNKNSYKYLKENQIEDNISNKFYTMLQKENNIILLKTSSLDKIKDCEVLYIPYEGHPSVCHNEKFYYSIMKLL